MKRRKSSGTSASVSSPRHSTPIRSRQRSEFELTQYIPLNKDFQDVRLVMLCPKCSSTCKYKRSSEKESETLSSSIKNLIDRLELANLCLEKDTDSWMKTLDYVHGASRSNGSLRKTLNDHWKATAKMIEHLSYASAALHSLIDKEEKLFSEIFSHSGWCQLSSSRSSGVCFVPNKNNCTKLGHVKP